jgi:hypothetical protein
MPARSSERRGPHIVVLRSEGAPFRITGVTGPVRPLPPSALAAAPDREHRISLDFEGADDRKPGLDDVTFTTDHPDQSHVTITVLFMGSRGENDE